MYVIYSDNFSGTERGQVHFINGELIATTNDPFIQSELDHFSDEGATPYEFFERVSHRLEMATSYRLFADDGEMVMIEGDKMFRRDPETGESVQRHWRPSPEGFIPLRPRDRSLIIICLDQREDRCQWVMMYQRRELIGIDEDGREMVEGIYAGVETIDREAIAAEFVREVMDYKEEDVYYVIRELKGLR